MLLLINARVKVTTCAALSLNHLEAKLFENIKKKSAWSLPLAVTKINEVVEYILYKVNFEFLLWRVHCRVS